VSAGIRVIIAEDGNVGIGTTTPSQKFHLVNGNALFNNNINSDTNSGFRIISTVGTTQYNWKLGIQDIADAGIDFTPSTIVGGNTFTTPVMVIKTTGVGIGTTNPLTKLHLESNSGELILKLNNIAAGGRNWEIASKNTSGVFSIIDRSSGLDRVLIDSAGNVGIGTTTPEAPLHLQGSHMLIKNGTEQGFIHFVTATKNNYIGPSDNNGLLNGITSGDLAIRAHQNLYISTGNSSTPQYSFINGNVTMAGSLTTNNTRVFKDAATAMTTTIDFTSTNNYTKTPSANETWAFTNIKTDAGIVVELTMGATLRTITCTQAGVTFVGDVTAGVIQGMAINKTYLIGFLPITTTKIWVSIKEAK